MKEAGGKVVFAWLEPCNSAADSSTTSKNPPVSMFPVLHP